MNSPTRLLRSIALIAPIALSLTACMGEPDGLRYPVPVGVGGGSGNAPAQPNNAPAPAPMAPLPKVQQPIKGEHLEDPEAEAERMGQTQSETVIAGTRAKAEAQCRNLAQGRTLKETRHFRDNQWECIFY